MKGIDVSKHQGVIDWDKVKAAGIDFAVIRAGLGKSTVDPQFVRNISACNRLGIPAGVYWFSYARNTDETVQEAKSCLAAVKPYRVEFPIFFDLEYDTDRYLRQQGIVLTKKMATDHAEAFLSAVEAAGYYAANYANPDYLSRFFDSGLLKKYDLWLANYRENADIDKPPRSCGIWQYWDKGRVSGIKGNVDLDVCYKNYPEVIRKAGLNGLVKDENTSAGWVRTEGGWTYGSAKNCWKKINGYWYWFNESGIAISGWEKIKGKWYYFLTEKDAEKTGYPECGCMSVEE